MANFGPDDHDLHGHVDGQLPADRAAAVERLVAGDADAAARADAWRRQNAAIRSTFGALDPVVPARLDPRAILRWRRGRLRAAVAGVALLLVGAAAGWFVRDLVPAQAAAHLAEGAIKAHRVFVVEVRHPVEVDATQEAHLVRWLSNRLGQPLRAPDLAPVGFRLMGGRLLACDTGPAAQFMYEDAAGRRMTLYVAHNPGNRETAFSHAASDGLAAFYWLDRELGYVLIGEADRPGLLRIAELVHRQIAP